MIPDASELARRRLTAQTVVRLLALVPVLGSLAPLGVVVGMLTFEIFSSGILYLTPAEIVPFGVVWVLLIAAAYALYAASGRLAVLMVPVYKRPRCPACGYAVEGLAEPRCPECSAQLTAEFMGRPPETRDGGMRRAYRAADIVGLFTPIVRLIGLGIALVFATASASVIASGVYEWLEWGFDSAAVVPLLVLGAFFGLIATLGIGMAMFGHGVARRMVPVRHLIEADAAAADRA